MTGEIYSSESDQHHRPTRREGESFLAAYQSVVHAAAAHGYLSLSLGLFSFDPPHLPFHRALELVPVVKIYQCIVSQCTQGSRFLMSSTEIAGARPAPQVAFTLRAQSSKRSIETQPGSNVLLKFRLGLESTLDVRARGGEHVA